MSTACSPSFLKFIVTADKSKKASAEKIRRVEPSGVGRGVGTALPKGWRRVAVKDMADSIQYGHTGSAIERRDGPRFLRITDIQDGRVDWSAVPSCDIPKEDV